jgi:hypothetical protein
MKVEWTSAASQLARLSDQIENSLIFFKLSSWQSPNAPNATVIDWGELFSTFKCSHNVLHVRYETYPSFHATATQAITWRERELCVVQSITTFHCYYLKVWSDSRGEQRMKEIIINWFWKATECAQLKRLRELRLKLELCAQCEMKINYQKEFFFFHLHLLFLRFDFNCSSSSYCHQSRPNVHLSEKNCRTRRANFTEKKTEIKSEIFKCDMLRRQSKTLWNATNF